MLLTHSLDVCNQKITLLLSLFLTPSHPLSPMADVNETIIIY